MKLTARLDHPDLLQALDHLPDWAEYPMPVIGIDAVGRCERLA